MFNHAAFSRDDVADARRGHPDVDLSSYAATRGWEATGPELTMHFGGTNPAFAHYVFNVVRGELVGGRFGVLQHELREMELQSGGSLGPGSFHGKQVTRWRGVKSMIGLVERGTKPFDRASCWLPTTAVRLQVPEAVLVAPLTVMTAAYSVTSNPILGPAAPGFRWVPHGDLTAEAQERLAAGLGPVLSGLQAEYVWLEVAYGTACLHVNGYLADPAALDRLVAAAGAIAEVLATESRPWWQPGPFDAPLGPMDISGHPPGYVSFAVPWETWGLDALVRAGQELGLTVEDPVQLHRRFPRLPLPGYSRGVLAGQLPGTAAFGRLTWQYKVDPGPTTNLLGGALFAAAPDARPTRAGGELLASTGMYVAVGEGVACCWSSTSTDRRLDSRGIAERALASMRETGLAAV